LGGFPCIGQALSQQGNHFTVLSAALALVFIQDDLVKRVAQNFGLLADVLVAPVSGTADDHRAACGRHGFHRLHQRQHGVRVVAIVGNHRRTPVLEQVETALRVVTVVGKGTRDRL
jgi:hypothetical protein